MATKKKSKRQSKFRASWKGQLTFGLVSFPVQAINALDRQQSDIHFHQLHATCHRRIHYQKVCPVHGEVTSDEIVSGYEHRKGQYIEIDPEELDALRTDSERALTIDAFVEPTEIDPVYFDGRMYYLLPDGKTAAEPYAVVCEAMEREECWGIGQVVFSGKEQLALVRPDQHVLHMAMLRYDEEIRPPAEVIAAAEPPRVDRRKIQLAQTLVRSWFTDDFDFTEYDDRYREKVKALIDAKAKGREIVAPEERETPEVINLMDALKQSLAQTRPHRGKMRHRHPRRSA
jgi:DNA end-binding protein Ku